MKTSGLHKRLLLASKYIFRKVDCKTTPIRLGIEVTNNCNLKCTMCPRNDMTRKVGDMGLDVFRKIIDDGKKHLELVALQDLGESLLNKDIFQMIKYCKENNVKTLLSTNSTLLNGEVAEKLLDSGLDYIIFAFDGVTKETYEGIRIGADYDQVIRNIRNFLNEKIKRGARMFCTLQCIYMKETEKEIKSFRRMWAIPGVDAIRIRQITHGVDIDDARQRKFSNINYKLPCYWPWSDPYIKWDGTMVPCCQDINAIYPLGRIQDSSLDEMWNSEKMQSLRRIHLSGDYSIVPLCKGCNMYKPRAPLVLGSAFFNAFTLQKLIPKVESIICKLRYKR